MFSGGTYSGGAFYVNDLHVRKSFPSMKVNVIKAATGNGAYAVAGIVPGDKVVAVPYLRFSGTLGTAVTTGVASLGTRGTGSLTFGKIVSNSMVMVYWLDVSA